MNTKAKELLTRSMSGDPAAAADLAPLVYQELREIARRQLGRPGFSPAKTLQPTALVHEVYLKLVGQQDRQFAGRTHFLAVAAKAIRHILIDHVRGNRRAKRGGDWERVSLTGFASPADVQDVELMALSEALEALAEVDPRATSVVELRFFGGLTEDETARELDVSVRTVRNDWSMARAWLRTRLSDAREHDAP